MTMATETLLMPVNVVIIAGLLVLVSLFYYLAHAIYNISFHPLSSFPGPKFAAVSGFPHAYYTLKGNMVHWTRDLHEEYGEIVRVKPNQLSFITETAWSDIFMHRQGRPQFQKFIFAEPVNGARSVLQAFDADHARQRKLLSHAFSEKALREQEPLLQSYIDLLIRKLYEECHINNGVVDVMEWYNYTTFDIIGDLSFAESFHNLDNKAEHAWIKSLFAGIKMAALLSVAKVIPPLGWFVNRVLPVALLGPRVRSLRFVQGKVRKRLSQGSERPDFMSAILRHNDEKGLTRDELDSNLALLMTAGSETTMTLLSGCTFHLLKNPRSLARLNEEVRGAFQSQADITIAAVNKLPYLLAVLEEALRMHPPVPTALPRIVPPGGNTISGRWVPGGTLVGIPQRVAYQSHYNFAQPTSFIPERWLEKHDAQFDHDRKSILQPFSAGPRNCLGKNLAYAEMRLILAKMVWNFDMELLTKGDWADQKVYILYQKTPLWVKLTPRAGR